MRDFAYFLLWLVFMAFGYLALYTHPENAGAGVVLALYVFPGSVGMTAFIAYLRSDIGRD